MTKKETLFKKLLDELNTTKKPENEEYKYIGTGNPNSDILIIGKETAVKVGTEQYKEETLTNFNFWYDWLNDKNTGKELFHNPFYPYKGQLLKKDNGSNMGTSTTWMKYQKLINNIYGKTKNIQIDFHENSFITEVNSTPSPKTIDANTSSIEFRKNNILNSDFFNDFKVIIISGVGYFNVDEDNNEIENIFKVKFSKKRIADNKHHQPYWIHWNEDKTKLLINTYQLSIAITDKLLEEVGEVIKKSNLLQS